MASRKVSVLKFVGTVSLGLLTGASYTLSNITAPALLDLPSAASAAKAFSATRERATTILNALTAVSSTAFLLAFALSPRGFRHPYLLYTSLLVFGTRLTGHVTPLLFSAADGSNNNNNNNNKPLAQRRAAAAAARREKSAARRMEASYEVLGDVHGDEAAGDEEDRLLEEELNGEEVRNEVDLFVRNQWVQGAVAGLGFAIAVVGLWGDAVYTRTAETFVIGLA